MFASNNDRLALRASNASFDACPFVVRFTKNGRDSEIACDDLEHALAVNAQWIQSGAEYVELFRVNEDGSLKATLGATVKEAA